MSKTPVPPSRSAALHKAAASPVYRNSTRLHGVVKQSPATQDWAPRHWHSLDAEAVDLMPLIAAPRFERRNRRRANLAGQVSLGGMVARPGSLLQRTDSEPELAPAIVSTFSEVLSLSMDGFVCKRVLTIDTSTRPRVVAEQPGSVAEAGTEAPPPPMADGAPSWVPALEARRGEFARQTGDQTPSPPLAPDTALPRAALGLRGSLPSIDWTAERLDQMATAREPGLVRLRSPRVRSPQLARLVKPAAGSSGPPIRVRPGVQLPRYLAAPPLLTMPAGGKVPLRFDTPVAGGRRHAEVFHGPVLFTAHARSARREAEWTPGMVTGNLAALRLEPSPGLRLTGERVEPATATAPRLSLALPVSPYVRGSEFDPPFCGLTRLVLRIEPRRLGAPQIASPPCRPVVSYRWVPSRPELNVRAGGDWSVSASRMTRIGMCNPAALAARVFAPEPGPVAGHTGPTLDILRRGTPSARGTGTPRLTGSLLPISLDDCAPRACKGTPRTKLEQIAPKPGHQLRKSSLRTRADWERNRWTSASVYGSALWRIAIGRFSGALDQAPKAVRWGGAVAALALAAFALLPGEGPSAPADASWTMANNAGTTAAVENDAASPAPVRVKPQPKPPAPAPVKPVRVARSTRGAAGATASSQAGGDSVWDNFQRRISERAAVAFTDDFRNGLAEWEGAGDWARSWSYDASGFVRTGAMALLAPSRDLTDYRMEFLGQIERRSMGWVVRAADMRNYYALKLMIVSDGPVPEVALIRYPVINGVAGAASQQALPIDVRSDTVYRVQTEVRGDYYAVTVQGKIVDSWTDRRLKRGSIGLFSGKGELARVRWVGVWHQYDTLGRLCALIAPSGLPGRERGANQ